MVAEKIRLGQARSRKPNLASGKHRVIDEVSHQRIRHLTEDIPEEVSRSGPDAVDAYRERIAICIYEGGLSTEEARRVALEDHRR